MQETWVLALGWEYPLEEGLQLTSVSLPGDSPRTEEPVGHSPWGHKGSDMAERLNTA